MHIPDGLLDVKTVAATSIVSGTALYFAFRKVTPSITPDKIPLMGVLASFVFAIQLLAFPVMIGTSVHITGAVLLAVILGPYTSFILITMILFLQAMLFQHGGILTLGANVLNLGIAGSLVGYLLYSIRRRFLVAGIAAFLVIILGGIFAAAELAISGKVPFGPALISMALAQSVTGIVEGIVTYSVLNVIHHVRPDLLELDKV